MSKIKVNSLEGVGASTPAITIDNASGTCTANLTNRTNKNIIVNGACLIAQRGTTSTSQQIQTVDRFNLGYNGQDEVLTQSQGDVASGTTPYNLGFRKTYKITNGNQTSGAGSSDYAYIIFPVPEAQDLANSGWNYTSTSSFITLSFYVKSSVAQNFYGYLKTSDGTSARYSFETGSLSADTWTKVTKTIPGNSNLSFDNDNGYGMEMAIWPFIGTDLTDSSATLNAWRTGSTGSSRTPDSPTTWWTTNDATFEITGLQLEVGSTATDFEHRSFAVEKRLCMRYYQQYVNIMMAGYVPDNSSRAYGLGLNFPVEMRSAPSITLTATGSSSGQTISDGSANAYVTSLLSSGAATHNVEFSLNLNTDLTDSRVAVAYGSGYSVRETTYQFSAEL